MNLSSIEDSELLKTIHASDISRVKSLLKEGADPDEKDRDGATALHYAAAFEHSGEIAKLLVEEHGLNIEATESGGITALRYALSRKNIPTLLFLIEKGASVDKKDNDGRTVMDWVDTYQLREEVENALALRQQKEAAREAAEAAQRKVSALHDTAFSRQKALTRSRMIVRLS